MIQSLQEKEKIEQEQDLADLAELENMFKNL
jgi:hypothetical protein